MDSYGDFMLRRRRAIEARDADPIRKARSEAWTTAGDDASIEERIFAANVAEQELRATMNVPEMATARHAPSSEEAMFPSDARSIAEFDSKQMF
jgi:hypothetical protein